MKTVFILIGLVVAVGLMVASFVSSDHSDDYPRLITVKARNFDITVNAIGVLDAASSHMVSSTIRGDRGKIIYLIPDGAQVSQGEILVKLDPAPFEAEVKRLESEAHGLNAAVEANAQMLAWEKSQVEREIRNAGYNLEVAELELNRLQHGEGPLKLSSLESEMTKVKEDYKRYLAYIHDLDDLAQKGFKHPREMATAREKCAELKEKFSVAEKNYMCYQQQVLPSLIKAGQAKVKQAEVELEQIKKGGVFKIAKAKAAYDEVRGKYQTVSHALANARSELEKTVIRAPSSGIAIHFEAYRDGSKRKPREGDRVLQNQPLLYLPDISSMVVKTQVREIDLHKTVVGQQCRVKVDAYPDAVFNGEISFIGALATEHVRLGRGEKYFKLSAVLKDHDDRLRPGMTARVTVFSDQVQNHLSIPVQAVFNEGGLAYCYRYRDKQYQRVAVTTGRQNEELVVIRSGLNPGDRISLVKPEMDH